MKKLYTLLIAAATVGSMSAQGLTKFDAPSMQAISQFRQLQVNPMAELPMIDMPFDVSGAVSRSATSPQVCVIVTFAPGYGVDDLADFGLEASTSVEDMAVVYGSLDDVEALADSDVVKSLSFGSTFRLTNDRARADVKMDDVNSGKGLTQAYKGTGVITGIYDMGVDANHINFFTDNNAATGTNRIKSLWVYGNTATPTVYATPERIAKFTTDSSGETHGTHTTGIMAGSYNGRGARWAQLNEAAGTLAVSATRPVPFYGMASGSDIVIGCGSSTNATVLDAIGRMVDYAKEQGKPIAINLSLGTSVGPHDGTDEFCQMLSKYGKDAIICIASGNESDMRATVSKTLTTTDNVAKTFIEFDGNMSSGVLDIWTSDNDGFVFTPCIVNRATGEVVYSYPLTKQGNYTVSTSDKITEYNRAYESTSSWSMSLNLNTNGNKRANLYMQYTLRPNKISNADKSLVTGIMIEGKAGKRVDIVCVPSSSSASTPAALGNYGLAGWSNGGDDLTVSSMACGDNVIVVGAYNTRQYWGVLSKYAYGFNGDDMAPNIIAPYSSYGVTVTGKSLPHVCAPGSGLISSISTYYYDKQKLSDDDVSAELAASHATANNRAHYWMTSQGTSMATPVVTGTIATWLEADPELTVGKAIEIIQKTATKDSYTASTGTPVQWGAGKLNAYEGIKEVISRVGVADIAADPYKVLISACGDNAWEVFAPTGKEVSATLYSISGAAVAKAHAKGDTINISADGVAPGIYILNVNGLHSERVVVK